MGVRSHPQIQPNDRFGRLTVIGSSKKKAGYPHFYWDCLCDCRETKSVTDNKLKTGEIRSCGCLRRETTSINGKARRTHGEAVHGEETPEYKAWTIRKSLTTDPSRKNYYGRGIKLCQGWWTSFLDFLAAVGRRPTPRHSIDRINNDGHYSCGKCGECLANGWPMNVRWATPKEQLRNTRVNKFLTINGETKCQAEWAEQFGLSQSSFSARLRRKWSIERIMTQPMRTRSTQPEPRLN